LAPLSGDDDLLLLPSVAAPPASATAQRPTSALLLGGSFALNVGDDAGSDRATTAAVVRPWGAARDGAATAPPAVTALPGRAAGAPLTAAATEQNRSGHAAPLRCPVAAASSRVPATESDSSGGGEAALAAGAAWGEALYGEYRGHARLAAQFVVASQALQGLAQAAGELTPRGLAAGPDLGAWASCVAATGAQLVVMGLCSAVLLWAQPHRARRNLDAETVPTVLQAGICAPIALLAARRWPPNATIAAWLDAALGASALLQPVLGILLALYEAASEVDFATVTAVLRARRAAGSR
jgi:hypothetical protein